MSVGEAVAGRLKSEAGEPGWEVDPDDAWGVAVIETVGRQLRLRREAVGMWAAEFAEAVGYGEGMVYKIEGGKRIPRQEYLDQADECNIIAGLLQTREHARAVIGAAQPPYSPDDVERMVGRASGPAVGLQAGPSSVDPLRAGRGAATSPGWGHNGVATAARTPAGGGAVEQRHISGHADQYRPPSSSC